jgi:hypothetical protein
MQTLRMSDPQGSTEGSPAFYIEWNDKSKCVFHQLKKALMTAPALVSQYRTSFNYMSVKREDWPWEW